MARRASPGVRALRQLRQPRQHVRRRAGGNSLGHSQQRPPVPVGSPSGARPRNATVVVVVGGASASTTSAARRLRRRDARAWRGREVGAAGGGPGAPRRGRVLDALRLELDAGERVRRRADHGAPVLRRPDGEREVRGGRVADGPHARRRRGDREGQGGGGRRGGDGARRVRRRAAAEGAGAQEQRGGVHGRGWVVLDERRQAGRTHTDTVGGLYESSHVVLFLGTYSFPLETGAHDPQLGTQSQ